MNTKVVGLDLGTHAVKVCELVTTFRNTELVGFASEPVEVGVHVALGQHIEGRDASGDSHRVTR